jgi:hypothetical protein
MGILALALALVISGFGSAFIPSPDRVALARDGTAVGDTLILAGPGGQYGILTVAPAGTVMSVDGDPVDGYYPVTFDGVSGWAPAGLLQVADGGGGGNGGNGGGGNGGGGKDGNRTREMGNGGTETVTADPVFVDGGAPVEPAPVEAAPVEAAPASGGAYGPGGAGYSEQQVIDIIYEAANTHGQSGDDMLRVARCESSLNPHAVGGGGAYHGLFQFIPSTFAGTPYGQYDIYDAWANANAAGWMWSQGKKSDWVCQ